jgi:hypothetical protein
MGQKRVPAPPAMITAHVPSEVIATSKSSGNQGTF